MNEAKWKREVVNRLKEPVEFFIMPTGRSDLNTNIERFRNEYPNYEVFNIGAFGTGGGYGGTSHWYVVWKLKDL